MNEMKMPFSIDPYNTCPACRKPSLFLFETDTSVSQLNHDGTLTDVSYSYKSKLKCMECGHEMNEVRRKGIFLDTKRLDSIGTKVVDDLVNKFNSNFSSENPFIK